jgi:hypothetical protein
MPSGPAQDSFADRKAFIATKAHLRARILAHQAASLSRVVDPPIAPIFIVGSPRSGTSLLFDILRHHEALGSLTHEGHELWNAYQHPAKRGWTSDRATAGDIAARERRYLAVAIHRISEGRRFLDKTPKNVMRLGYLAGLFPDAKIVFLRRSGPAAVGSLIEGWSKRRGISYRLPCRLNLKDYEGRLWSYILPPNWRQLIGTSIAQVAAAQYVSSNEQALADRQLLPPGMVIDVRFEELVAQPIPTIERLVDTLELQPSRALRDRAEQVPGHHVGSLSPPRDGKWREQRGIHEVLPGLRETMTKLGYEEDW